MSTDIFAFVIVLGILVFFHEFGHFIMARLFGVGVEKFSLGFGPRLFGKKVGITDYRVSAVPLGGYVKMVGEEPDSDVAPADIPVSFTHKHVFKRMIIVAAGPLFNLILAVMIFFVIFLISGTFILKPVVGTVEQDSPAAKAGIVKGDLIESIDGTPVTNWEEMAEIISGSDGKRLSVSVMRNGEALKLDILPELKTAKNIFGEDIKRYAMGIASAGDFYSKELNPFEALYESIRQTYKITYLTVVSIVKLIQGSLSAKTLGGPIMIAEMAGQQAREGIANLAFFIALLSINLAVLNFLPIPVLDGGHLLFFFIEAVIGKPVNTKMREIAQQVGIFVLIVLMIYVFYNDITRIFFS
ncbi:MAG: regulator of sigma protease [Thermodesulfobacteriota bacterium]|jgi:regulator of sigma E protease|nr:regulator of sigma protease [Thermodesulfobacteriota bacterium]